MRSEESTKNLNSKTHDCRAQTAQREIKLQKVAKTAEAQSARKTTMEDIPQTEKVDEEAEPMPERRIVYRPLRKIANPYDEFRQEQEKMF